MKDYTIYLEIDTGQKLRYYISPVMQNDGKVLLRCAEKGMEMYRVGTPKSIGRKLFLMN